MCAALNVRSICANGAISGVLRGGYRRSTAKGSEGHVGFGGGFEGERGRCSTTKCD